MGQTGCIMLNLVFIFASLTLLSACTTPAEEDEPSNNAAPAEDAGGETPDASAPDVEQEVESDPEVCLSITDPEECRAQQGACALVNFYPVRIEDGQCMLDIEPSEQICTGGDFPQERGNMIWVRFHEDGTYYTGLVRGPAANDAWQYCYDGVDVPECACEGLLVWPNETTAPLP